MDKEKPILEIKDIHTYYGHIQVLKGVSLEVGQSEMVTLIGSNGAGKSTLLHTISGLIKPSRGQIFLMDRKLINFHPMRSSIGEYCRFRKEESFLTD